MATAYTADNSSVLTAYGWANGSMWVTFRSGRTYQAPAGAVPSYRYATLCRSRSKGRVFNRFLRSYFVGRQVA